MRVITRICVILCLLSISMDGQAQDKQYKIAAVGFYNFENLFDTLDTDNVRDEEFTPEGSKVWNSQKYQEKLNNLSYVISNMATDKAAQGLSVLGVSEIENRSVLEDLIAMPDMKPMDWGIVHFDSQDLRGVDVGLIYRKKHFEVTSSSKHFVELYDDKYEPVFTRDVLLVSGLLDGEQMHFLVNHWPSRSGGEKRSAPRRNAAADVCRHVIDSLYSLDANAKIVLLGDLNDNPNNKSLTKHLGAVGKVDKLKANGMFNPMQEMFDHGYGSNAYRDSWSLFDQILVSEALVSNPNNGFKYFKANIYNKKFLVQSIGQFKGYPFRTFVGDSFQGGYSDHFPVYVYLVKG